MGFFHSADNTVQFFLKMHSLKILAYVISLQNMSSASLIYVFIVKLKYLLHNT